MNLLEKYGSSRLIVSVSMPMLLLMTLMISANGVRGLAYTSLGVHYTCTYSILQVHKLQARAVQLQAARLLYWYLNFYH